MKKSILWRLRISTSLGILLALVLSIAQMGGSSNGYINVFAQNQKNDNAFQDVTRRQSQETFKKGRQLLIDYGVTFEPNDLFDQKRRQELISKIDALPEFHISEQIGNRLSGVKIADTLYLPEKIKLDGDT